MRLTGESLDIFKYIEPLYNDYRKIRKQDKEGGDYKHIIVTEHLAGDCPHDRSRPVAVHGNIVSNPVITIILKSDIAHVPNKVLKALSINKLSER